MTKKKQIQQEEKRTVQLDRKCDGCTACCDGWLTGTAYNKQFYPGHPCHFSSCNGCAIYEDRPEFPCKVYSCEWILNGEIPEWMKPNKSNVIITRRDWDHPDGSKQMYLDVVEIGTKIDSTVLNWFFMFHLRTQIPLKIQIERGFNWYGSKEFIEATGNQVTIFNPPDPNNKQS